MITLHERNAVNTKTKTTKNDNVTRKERSEHRNKTTNNDNIIRTQSATPFTSGGHRSPLVHYKHNQRNRPSKITNVSQVIANNDTRKKQNTANLHRLTTATLQLLRNYKYER